MLFRDKGDELPRPPVCARSSHTGAEGARPPGQSLHGAAAGCSRTDKAGPRRNVPWLQRLPLGMRGAGPTGKGLRDPRGGVYRALECKRCSDSVTARVRAVALLYADFASKRNWDSIVTLGPMGSAPWYRLAKERSKANSQVWRDEETGQNSAEKETVQWHRLRRSDRPTGDVWI